MPKIPQLRIEVTSRCGPVFRNYHYRCLYCRPGGEGFPTKRELAVYEIVEIVKHFIKAGVAYVKITGGEPLVRADILELVHGLSEIHGVREIHLVSRHPKAGELAKELAEAGLFLLNFSLDSLCPETWCRIVQIPFSEGSKLHTQLMDAIEYASTTTIPRIKINTVVLRHLNDGEIPELIKFARKVRAELKLEELIRDISFYSPDSIKYYRPLNKLPNELSDQILKKDITTQPGGLGHPMPRLFLKNGGVVTIKTYAEGAWYGNVCMKCRFMPCDDALMALRCTPDGKIQFCLKRNDNLINFHQLISSTSPQLVQKEVQKILNVYKNANFFTYSDITSLRALHNERKSA
jgi:cyclic pyranopterin phosphate synthase